MYDELLVDFTPLKIYTKWSKVMSATYMVFVDYRNCKESKSIRERLVEKINSYWQDCPKQGLLISITTSNRVTCKTDEL